LSDRLLATDLRSGRCTSPLAAGRGCFLLPSSAPKWLHSWTRKGPNRLCMLLASFLKHQQTRSSKAFTGFSTNTVPRSLILLPHYLLPSNGLPRPFSLQLDDAHLTELAGFNPERASQAI